MAWELANGPIPAGMHILHSCDNRACVNPTHLRAGTHADNMRDMSDRGRHRGPAGEAHHFARFDAESVRRLRDRHAEGETILSLAKESGVAYNAMWRIIRRKAWKHVG